MDCFYAAVELLERADLSGTPVAVGYEQPRSIVLTCNYEARAYGIHSAMSCVQARKLCAELTFLPPNFDKYRAISTTIHAIMRTYTKNMEPLALDEAYLDVTKCHLFDNHATEIARSIKEEIYEETGLTSSAGVSVNKFLAKTGSGWHKPNGITVIPPHKVNDFVRDLPVKKIPGVGKVTLAKLQKLHIHTCGDLQQWNTADLVKHFGTFGKVLAECARGEDQRAVQPHRPRKSLSVESTYPHDLQDHMQCQRALATLLDSLKHRLQKNASSVPIKGVFIKIKFSNFTIATRHAHHNSLTLEQFIRLYHRAVDSTRNMPIRLIGIGVHFTEPTTTKKEARLSAQQFSLKIGE